MVRRQYPVEAPHKSPPAVVAARGGILHTSVVHYKSAILTDVEVEGSAAIATGSSLVCRKG